VHFGRLTLAVWVPQCVQDIAYNISGYLSMLQSCM